MITQDELKQMLSYDPKTGIFTWLISRGKRKKGSRAGSYNSDKYRRIQIKGKSYYEHQLAFLFMTGTIPEEIDHSNHNPSDNRWCNLRKATRAQNGWNKKLSKSNKTGFKGVSFNQQMNKYHAQIYVNKKRIHLGYFITPEEAHEAYCKKADELHGEYKRYE